ncbi:hypothetical protein ACJX0J_018376, partial [Zea mays]
FFASFKVVKFYIMENLIIILHMNSHVDFASHNNIRYFALNNYYVDNILHHMHHNLLSTINYLGELAMVQPTNSLIIFQINKNSSNAHDSTSYSFNRIHGNSAVHTSVITHDLAFYKSIKIQWGMLLIFFGQTNLAIIIDELDFSGAKGVYKVQIFDPILNMVLLSFKINLDCIFQHIIPNQEGDNNILSKFIFWPPLIIFISINIAQPCVEIDIYIDCCTYFNRFIIHVRLMFTINMRERNKGHLTGGFKNLKYRKCKREDRDIPPGANVTRLIERYFAPILSHHILEIWMEPRNMAKPSIERLSSMSHQTLFIKKEIFSYLYEQIHFFLVKNIMYI